MNKIFYTLYVSMIIWSSAGCVDTDSSVNESSLDSMTPEVDGTQPRNDKEVEATRDADSVEPDSSIDAELVMDSTAPNRDAALDASSAVESPLSDERRSGIFRQGCPRAGFAHARVLSGSGEMSGDAVIADSGDLLLMNQQVAFVIQDPTRESRTWWYYGGQVVDTIPLIECAQVDIDRLDSLGMVILEGALDALESASIRAFSGERAEVINDGSGGIPARVRVYGSDAPMWLVDFELMRRAVARGEVRERSEPLNVSAWIDYVLEPDSPVLHIELGVTNLSGEPRVLRAANLSFFADDAAAIRFEPSEVRISGVNLRTGLPWLAAGRMAIALDALNTASASFAGVDLLLDFGRAVLGDQLSAYQGAGRVDSRALELEDPIEERLGRADTTTWSLDLSTHRLGLSAAASALAESHPQPSPGRDATPRQITLSVSAHSEEIEELRTLVPEIAQGAYQREARLELWVIAPGEDGAPDSEREIGQLGELNEGIEAPEGEEGEPITWEISLPVSALALPEERYELRYYAPGSPEVRSQRFIFDERGEVSPPLERLNLPPRGALRARILDQDGALIPARLDLRPLDQPSALSGDYEALPDRSLIHLIGERVVAVAPGRYRYALSRGYEYQPQTGEVIITPGEITTFERVLTHINPTPGYVSFDAHVHAGPSPDSDIAIADRLRGAAAVGLEVVAGTDHEVVTDWARALTPSQAEELRPWVRTIVAAESTASLPEHMNIYPIEVNEAHPRGEPPRWYNLGFTAFTEALADRGATVRQLNHPRSGCNYLCLIEYNRRTGEADTPLPPIAFGADVGELWGWGFNAVELLNGPQAVFIDPQRPERTGLFEDWASFINLGHRVTAMGVTDTHHTEGLGSPVTLVQIESESEASARTVDPAQIAEAIVAGRAQISLGAWAEVSVEGVGLGDVAVGAEVEPGRYQARLEVSVRALPEVDVRWVYVFVNCDLAHTWESPTPDELLKLSDVHTLSLEADAWVSVMAFGESPMPEGLRQYPPQSIPRVLTNAIYIDADRDGQWTPPGGKHCAIPAGR